MTDKIAAWAAVAAAVFSFINVLVSNRFLHRNQTRQWRRDSGKKLIIDFCLAIGDLRTKWKCAVKVADDFRVANTPEPRPFFSIAPQFLADEFNDAARETQEAAARALRLKQEIELMMSAACSDVASKFLGACYAPVGVALSARSKIEEARVSEYYDWEVDRAHKVFIEAFRRDLGIGPKPFEYTLFASLVVAVVNARQSARSGRASEPTPASE